VEDTPGQTLVRETHNDLAPLPPLDTSSLPKIDMMKFVDT